MITIVTAFYDIGRSEWAAFPRSVETYFKAFERMCRLQNDIILFTEEKFRARAEEIKRKLKPSLTIHYMDIYRENVSLLQQIKHIQDDPEFQDGITDLSCPEYREPKYILINYLKSTFCLEALKLDPSLSGTIAWIDFGYCRKDRYLPFTKQWDYAFEDKIHMFNLLDVHDDINIVDTIKKNTVYIQGCHIVAHPQGWAKLNTLMKEVLGDLLKSNLIDDDQTFLLLAYLRSKPDFVLHKAELTKAYGWFFIFRHFNSLGGSPFQVIKKLKFWLGL